MASIFDKLLKAADSQFGSLVEDNNDADVVSYIDTGSYSLNAILSGDIFGGLPSNKVSAIAGDPSTGKTFFAIHIIKGFLEANPEAAVYYFESETAVTTDMLKDAGIDTSRFFIMPVGTVEEFRTQCVKILDAYLEIKPEDRPPMFMVLDSLGMLSTNKETSDIATGSDKRDMTKAPLIKGAFRVITMKLGRAKVPLLVTNHLYNVIGAYIPTKAQGGGEGLPYAASSILYFTKSKKKDKDKNIVGALITAKNPKSRLTIENREIETLIHYQKGLDRYYGLLDIAELGGLVTKNGSKYVLCGLETKFTTADGFADGVYKEPEKYFTKEVLEQINSVVKRHFKYGGEDKALAEEKVV